jgi:hypothetical protein
METQSDTLKEILSELFALLETQETNSSAVLQLLKDQGIASDEKLSIYLDQAGKASNVKWRAARMRMEYLLTPIQKETQKETTGSDKSKQPEPKESQSPEAANKLEEDQRNNQAKENQAKGNANEKEQKEASTKSPGKDIAKESGDPKRDASNGAPKDNQHTSSKQTA